MENNDLDAERFDQYNTLGKLNNFGRKDFY